MEKLAQSKLEKDLHLPTINNQQIQILQELGIKIENIHETEENIT